MEKYKWINRIVLISTPDFENAKYKNSINLYNQNKESFDVRRVKLVSKVSNIFTIYLIGLDGTIKKKYSEMNPEEIFRDIDAMPMSEFIN